MKYIYIIILFVFFSCGDMENVIDLEIPPHEPVLVLNGIFSTDDTASVTISHSVGAFDLTVPAYLPNAEVLLYKDNVLVGEMQPDFTDMISVGYIDVNDNAGAIDMFYYKSDHIAEKNKTYRVEVNHPNLPSVSASTYLPSDVSLFNIDVDTNTALNDGMINFSFSFNDDPSVDNYYQLRVFSTCSKEYEDYYGYYEQWYFSEELEILSNDPSFPPSGIPFDGYAFAGYSALFTDDLFNGQQKDISFDVDLEEDGWVYSKCDTVIFEFSTFSNETYSYFSSLDLHVEKGPVGIFGGEVVPVYSNVQDGLGVLMSNNMQQVFLKP